MTNEDLTPLPVSRRVQHLGEYLFVKVRKPQACASGFKTIDLSVGDPDESVNLEFLKEALHFAGKKIDTRYPMGRGLPALRRAISRWMKYRYNVKIDPESEIMILSGAKEGIAHTIHALIDPGDVLWAGSLHYPVYSRAAALAGGRMELLPMKESGGYWLDYSKARKNGKAVFFNYPNNPTGAVADLARLKDLARWAAAKRAWLLSDAAYAELSFDQKKPAPSIFEVPGAHKTAVEFHSFSKTFGLPGLRLGWACGQARLISALSKIKDNYDSGVSNMVQAVGQFLLEMPGRDKEFERLKRIYGERRRFFVTELRNTGFDVFESGATFYVWAKTPWPVFADDLRDRHNVLTVPGGGFGPDGKNYVRFALCAGQARLQEAAQRIRDILK
ncbi:MAG: aminotransferase class I/II-fold pyridoxal phosphate-dependent enzyme [Elusimicrobia bacterium]|nr:aminotransferase class I/II-fold pyridoxal phosphate-dependent enzyme [Elusimicrobiota bacterium]